MKTFSIVIPAYNEPLLLKRAVDSVLSQDMTDFELIIADDSTTTEVQQYVESLHMPCVSYHRHKSTGHAADNWNFALQQASGDYIILMHHDEAMKSTDHLSRIARQMANGADICVSDIEVITGNRKKPSHLPAWMKRAIIAHPAWLFLINAIGPSACISFRREQAVMFRPALQWLVDVEWYYRLLKDKRVVYLPDCCMQSIHGHASQLSSTLNIAQAFASDRRIILQTYSDKTVRLMTRLYGLLIIKTKKILGKI